MKSSHLLIGLALLCTSGATAQNPLNPMTAAVMQVYNQAIQANPGDYEALFKRANEYYLHNEYMRALDDATNALKYCPPSDKDMRTQILMLQAGIYDITGQHDKAMLALTQAEQYSPGSYLITYQKANTEYEMGHYAEARADYQRVLQMHPRSPEAVIGLARIEVQNKNYGRADELLDQAVALDPTNADMLVRRATVHRLMGNDTRAVDDLLIALSTDGSNSRAIKEIVDMANVNYGAVMSALAAAIKDAPNVGMFYYLRAVIAQAHYQYGAAISDFDYIIDNRLYQYHGLYASLATCYLGIGDYLRALQAVDQAIGMVKDYAPHYVLRSRILLAMGDAQEALAAADHALMLDIRDTEATVQKGLCLMATKDYDGALQQFGIATIDEPSNPYYYMLRAWVLNDDLRQPEAARGFYDQVIEMSAQKPDDVKTYRGFALLFTGRTDEATAWMQHILDTCRDDDGIINYYGACLYAQAGDTDKAMECVRRSLDLGMADYYMWTVQDQGRISVEPLRDLLAFRDALKAHASLFELPQK